jgi:ABC-type branched-subunit amino acid transport system substrate-binding protein
MFLSLLHAGILIGCGSNSEDLHPQIVFGSLFMDDVSEQARLDLAAVQMAVDEINAAGIFDKSLKLRNITPAKGGVPDADKAGQNMQTLYDQENIVGLITTTTVVAEGVIALTNQPEYRDLIQCSCDATGATLNMDDMGGDTSDSFYRNTVSDMYFVDIGIRLMGEKNWKNVALYRANDTFGAGVSLTIQLALLESAASGYTLVVDEVHPEGPFDLELNKDAMDKLILMAKRNQLDLLLIMSQKLQAASILRYLTENGFSKPIWIGVGAKEQDILDSVSGIAAWTDENRYIFGLEADNYAGVNSAQFVDTYVSKFDENPNYSSSNAYDCVYAMALSLLYADQITALEVKENMRRFKQENRLDDEVDIGIGSDGLKKAADSIGDQKQVNYRGASGQVIFDQAGDRPSQGVQIFGPNSDASDWEIKERYDADFNKIEG